MTIRATWAFNGQTKTILGNWHRFWCLLFGPLYYSFKGMWLWAILSLITANGLGVGFPLYNRAIVQSCCGIITAKAGRRNDHERAHPSSLLPEWNPAGSAETQRRRGPHEKLQLFGSGSNLTD